MGKEIVYCETCGSRILEEDFEKGTAITLANKNYCPKCKEHGLKDYNPSYEDLENTLEETEPAKPPTSRIKQTSQFKTSTIGKSKQTGKLGRYTSHKVSTAGRFAYGGKRPHIPQPQGSKNNKMLLIILAVVAVIIIVIIIATAK